MQYSLATSILFAAFLTLGHTVLGQRPAFVVYNAVGNIKCTLARGGGSESVFLHYKLYERDRLTLPDNIDEITLIDCDTNYIRLRGKSAYTMAEIKKMPRIRVRDTMLIQYLSFLTATDPTPTNRASTDPTSTNRSPTNRTSTDPPSTNRTATDRTPANPSPSRTPVSPMIAPCPAFATSMDSLIFRWHPISWARKYFLRLRSMDGQLRYDSVVVDTTAVVHFPGHMPVGNSYAWTLDIVGESGRLQFSDSNHIVLVDESTVLAQLPPITEDSIGGIAPILQRIEQYERAGCIRQADDLFHQLTTDMPQDAALDNLYSAFRNRNNY